MSFGASVDFHVDISKQGSGRCSPHLPSSVWGSILFSSGEQCAVCQPRMVIGSAGTSVGSASPSLLGLLKFL